MHDLLMAQFSPDLKLFPELIFLLIAFYTFIIPRFPVNTQAICVSIETRLDSTTAQWFMHWIVQWARY